MKLCGVMGGMGSSYPPPCGWAKKTFWYVGVDFCFLCALGGDSNRVAPLDILHVTRWDVTLPFTTQRADMCSVGWTKRVRPSC